MTTNTNNTGATLNTNITTNWTKITEGLYGVRRTIKVRNCAHTILFRIDAREGSYRVDRLGSLGYAWEAIDNGQGCRTLAEAKARVSAYCKAAKAQGDLCPRL